MKRNLKGIIPSGKYKKTASCLTKDLFDAQKQLICNGPQVISFYIILVGGINQALVYIKFFL